MHILHACLHTYWHTVSFSDVWTQHNWSWARLGVTSVGTYSVVAARAVNENNTFKKITHRTQNGFTGGRHFLNNLVVIDTCSRIYSMMHSVCTNSDLKNIPIAGAFDFEAAFPSVIHAWIWMVLHHRKMPLRFIRLFQSTYKNARAIYTHKGKSHTLINFLSGVLQGCPASASCV